MKGNELFEVMNKNRVHAYNTKKISLNSGLSLSIQASEFHYCSPRESLGDYSLYDSFEVGFPSEEVELLKEYAEDEDFTNTVYACVPKDVILAVVESNGGVVDAKL